MVKINDRYARQMLLPEIGILGQQRLAQSKVLLVGVGGLGCPAALYLAAAGVGTLGLVDDDNVALNNLHRQILFHTDDVGLSKVVQAKNVLSGLNREINVITYQERLSLERAKILFSQYDIIIDGTDNFKTRYCINDVCVQLKKPFVYGGITQFKGQCSIFAVPGNPCYRCLFPTAEQALIPNCAEAGVLGVLPGIIGSIQATQVLLWLLQCGEPLIGKLFCIDVRTMQTQLFSLSIDPQCAVCMHSKSSTLEKPVIQSSGIQEISVETLQQWLERKEDFILVDVREPFERAMSDIGGLFIPLAQLPARYQEISPTKKIVIYCRSGHRSGMAVNYLQSLGYTRVWNLQDGIKAWAARIMPIPVG